MANGKIGKRAVAHLKKLLKNTPTDVLGHIDSAALCCRVGTVAIVKVDLASNPPPTTKGKARTSTSR